MYMLNILSIVSIQNLTYKSSFMNFSFRKCLNETEIQKCPNLVTQYTWHESIPPLSKSPAHIWVSFKPGSALAQRVWSTMGRRTCCITLGSPEPNANKIQFCETMSN